MDTRKRKTDQGLAERNISYSPEFQGVSSGQLEVSAFLFSIIFMYGLDG